MRIQKWVSKTNCVHTVFIETPKGHQVLIDGGPGRAVLSELSRIMPALDRSLDVVVATHTDLDHIGGLAEVADKYDIGMAVENGFAADSGIYQTFEKKLDNKKITRRKARAGDRLVLDSGIHLDILGPVPEDFTPPPEKPNEVMIVARLIYGESEFLFMGDIERGDELRFLSSGLDVQSDVLKVAHHGSRFSTTDLFLEKVSPHHAVISVGGKNSYGHPHKETLERLARSGATLSRTDRDGRVTFISDGKDISVE